MVDDYLGQAPFHLDVLPARVAYLIAPSSRGGFHRAVQEACSRWAGMTEPIIPVWRNGRLLPWWRQCVDIAQLDALVRVDASPSASQRAATQLGLPLIELSHIDLAGPSHFTCNPVAIVRPGDDLGSGPVAVLASDQRALWQVTACGDLTDAMWDDMSRSLLVMNRSLPEDQVGRAQLRGESLLDLGVAQFSENMGTDGPTVAPTIIWVTTNDDLRDCLYFWNLRALRPLRFRRIPMILVPGDSVEQWLDFDQQLAGVLARPADLAPDVLLGGRVPEDQLHRIAQVLGLERGTATPKAVTRIPPPPNRTPPFTYRTDIDPRQFLVFGRSYGTATEVTGQLFRHNTQVDIPSSVTFRRPGGYVLLGLSSPALDSYPRRDVVASLIQQNATWRNNRVQIATLGH